ncbi:MAG: efflux RND transporter periplasmic adaptor subunit [Melioribacteraceae bacterium]|nr:efflux RND transporter periplasmic adaptor subunit [Melioribacteraceae bacterium]
MKIPIKIIAIPFVIVIIIIAAYQLFSVGDTEKKDGNKISNVDYGTLDEIIFDVRTSNVLKGELIKTTNANGIIRANRELDIVANIPGYISNIHIYEGKYVAKGLILVQLDDKEYQIALKEAEDQLIEARVEYGFLTKDTGVDTMNIDNAVVIEKQISQLDQQFNKGMLSEEEYLTRRDELELKLIFTGAKREELILNKSGFSRAVNAKERSELNLAYTKIKAPFPGVIGDFDLVVGQRVNSGEKLFKLIDVSGFKIDVGVLESEIVYISKGNRVEIKVNALADQTFEGKVVFVSPYIDTETKTCKVSIEIANPDNQLKSGMFATVKIETASLKDRILVPKDALLVRDRRNLVFTVEDSLAKWKYVDIGEKNDEYIEILKGVTPGEEVIVEGHYTLAHDARIRVLK